jgi:hypothetical protein
MNLCQVTVERFVETPLIDPQHPNQRVKIPFALKSVMNRDLPHQSMWFLHSPTLLEDIKGEGR